VPLQQRVAALEVFWLHGIMWLGEGLRCRFDMNKDIRHARVRSADGFFDTVGDGMTVAY